MKFRGALNILILLSIGGCSGENETGSNFLLDCSLPSEQADTLNGRFQATPIPIALQTNQWSFGGSSCPGSEAQCLVNAIDTINAFSQVSFGFDVLQFAGEFNDLPLSQGCPTTVTDGSTYFAPVTIQKHTNDWPYASGVIGLTTFCTESVSGVPLPVKFAAQIQMNYQHFFLTAKKPDLETTFLHELMHLIGLRHSCEFPSGNPNAEGMPDCGSSDLPFEFFEALMYPVFEFVNNQGQVKTDLRSNDQSRFNCIYK